MFELVLLRWLCITVAWQGESVCVCVCESESMPDRLSRH